ncbi:MAG: uracil-DNA glycosylase [Flavobacteriaceae bacterium]|jgi:uracil-DNA glycosylase|tara:strand:- start:3553 stop:4218 length:666 start_codon:yes stop_codon:yes gene_type:complete
MTVEIHPIWEKALQTEFNSVYFNKLNAFITSEYKSNRCFPPKDEIYSAFNSCPYDIIKVVLLGQDPYHGFGQAHGLSFSVPEGIKHPPSLINIFKELQTDLNIDYPTSGNLSHWAAQGVLLLNATLTVGEYKAGSHQKKGWEKFTDSILQKISDEKEGVVFILWGGFAKKKIKFIDSNKHLILSGGHPSPLSANRGYWFGNKHFSQCNSYLQNKGEKPIEW